MIQKCALPPPPHCSPFTLFSWWRQGALQVDHVTTCLRAICWACHTPLRRVGRTLGCLPCNNKWFRQCACPRAHTWKLSHPWKHIKHACTRANTLTGGRTRAEICCELCSCYLCLIICAICFHILCFHIYPVSTFSTAKHKLWSRVITRSYSYSVTGITVILWWRQGFCCLSLENLSTRWWQRERDVSNVGCLAVYLYSLSRKEILMTCQ